MEYSIRKVQTFCEVFSAVIKEHGVEGSAELFYKFLTNHDPKNVLRIIEEQIFLEIEYVYGCTRILLRTSNKRKTVPVARAMCILLLQKHIDITQDDLSILFNRIIDRTAVNKIIGSFRKCLAGYQVTEEGYSKLFTADFMKKFQIIDKRISDFKEKLVDKHISKKIK